MKNLGQMMKQAQKMQQKMTEMQEELQSMEVTGESGAGMLKVTLNGKGQARSLKIDPSLIDPSDPIPWCGADICGRTCSGRTSA